jgi:hypothetical protein
MLPLSKVFPFCLLFVARINLSETFLLFSVLQFFPQELCSVPSAFLPVAWSLRPHVLPSLEIFSPPTITMNYKDKMFTVSSQN